MSIQRVLREGGSADFEGVTVYYAGEWDALKPGDTYVAERNSGPKLLTVREVVETLGDRNQWTGAVFPVENAYPFDLNECVKVSLEAPGSHHG